MFKIPTRYDEEVSVMGFEPRSDVLASLRAPSLIRIPQFPSQSLTSVRDQRRA